MAHGFEILVVGGVFTHLLVQIIKLHLQQKYGGSTNHKTTLAVWHIVSKSFL
jgi:hypothetical protein